MVMGVNIVHQTVSAAIQNKLSGSTDYNNTNNYTRTHPDAIPTPAVKLPSGFVTAQLEFAGTKMICKSECNP